MADVSGPPRSRSAHGGDATDGSERTDRAQLFVLTALVLAVLFVALALLLNTAIFTENLATRSTDPGVSDAIEFRGSMDESMGDVINATNMRYDQGATALPDGLDTVVADWSRGSLRHSLSTGHDATVTAVSVDSYGGTIAQTETLQVTNDTGANNWTVASGISAPRSFNMTLEQSGNLAQEDDPTAGNSKVFSLRASDGGGGQWQLFAYDDTSSAEAYLDLQIRSTAGDKRCTGYRPNANLDLIRGTVNGSCTFPPLTDAMSGSFDLEVVRGENVTGEYRLVVPETKSSISGSVHAGTFGAEGTGDPYVAEAIWTATFNVSYDGPDVAYGGEVTVTP